MVSQHPWHRFVALGDSFTEGVGDDEPKSPGGLRGWADRVAEVLNEGVDDFAYANLAIRGRLLQQIVDEQIEPAIAMQPDLVSLCAGGNDLLRPGSDPDDLARILDEAVGRLATTGATIVLFTGIDTGASVFRLIRGKVAIYNMNIYRIARKYDAVVVDQWALDFPKDPQMWAEDRLHFNSIGHHNVAIEVLRSLNVKNDLRIDVPDPLPHRPWREARAEDLVWAKDYLLPWVLRRLRHESSGDGRVPKRPETDYLN